MKITDTISIELSEKETNAEYDSVNAYQFTFDQAEANILGPKTRKS